MVPTLSTELDAPKAAHHASWQREFADLSPEDPSSATIDTLYYKSECRPLKTLQALFNREKTAKNVSGIKLRAWLELRDRARKDLYWLGHDCIATPESGSGFVEHVHREMCAQFVSKNFDGVYHEGYSLDDVRNHLYKLREVRSREMLTLTPTGSFKSTANKIDTVQWLLNAPDLRILIVTGSGQLSTKFLREVKGFFYCPAGQKPTFFQALFPEYVIDADSAETSRPLTCPARVHRQPGAPSVGVFSIDGVVAGWHCDIWKADDIVNEDNSNNEDTRMTLKDRYDNLSSNRPDKWAFIDMIGTRYYPGDYYGERIKEALLYKDTNSLQLLVRAAWTVKPEFVDVPRKHLQEHMVDLYFPEFMPFEWLMNKCRKNEGTFACQQLNSPEQGDLAVNFGEKDIEAATITMGGVPHPKLGLRVPRINWDTAHEDKVQSDYSCGSVGYVDTDKSALYILEVVHGKWKDSKCCIEVVDLHWKWTPPYSEIEKFHGHELFDRECQRYSMGRYGKRIPIRWYDADCSAHAKRTRIKGLEILLTNDRLFFVDGDWMDDLKQQFTRFTGFAKRRKDDIPDSIGRLQKYLPAMKPEGTPAPVESERTRLDREAEECRAKFWQQHQEGEYNRFFGQAPTPAIQKPQDRTAPNILAGFGINL